MDQILNSLGRRVPEDREASCLLPFWICSRRQTCMRFFLRTLSRLFYYDDVALYFLITMTDADGGCKP
jgi:hypothetical protein